MASSGRLPALLLDLGPQLDDDCTTSHRHKQDDDGVTPISRVSNRGGIRSGRSPFSSTRQRQGFKRKAKDGAAVSIQREVFAVDRAHLAGEVEAADQFNISMRVVLKAIPEEMQNILHCVIASQKGSHLPSISVVAGTTRILAQVREGPFMLDILSHEDGLNLGAPSRIQFTLVAGHAILEVNGVKVKKQCERLCVPVPAQLHVFLSSPWLRAAEAEVSRVEYCSRIHRDKAHARGEIDFQVPPAEQQLMQAVHEELAQNRKWRRFDMFFGLFILANSLSIGLEIEFYDSAELSLMFKILNGFFLVVFVVELILRAVLTGRGWYRVLPRDGWIIFDLVVIIFGVLNLWCFAEQMPSIFRSFWLLRLGRLARMVRLVRVFKELGFFIQGLFNAFLPVCYTLLLVLVILWAIASMIVRLEGNSDCQIDCKEDWTSMWPAIWRLAQMITLDNWTPYVRNAFFTVPAPWGAMMGMLMLTCIALVGLGVLNMVVGVLCNIAFEINKKEKRRSGVELLLKQKEALRSFARLLRSSGERPLFKSDRFVTPDEICGELLDDPQVCEETEVLRLTRSDFLMLCETFEENAEIEIDGLVEAIGIRQLQAYYNKFKMDESVFDNKITSAARPEDGLFFVMCIREAEKLVGSTEDSTRGVCALAYDALGCLYERAQAAHTMLRINAQLPWAAPKNKSVPPASDVGVKELRHVAEKPRAKDDAELYMNIDLIFGALILINGAFVGIQVFNENPTLEPTLYVIDLLFTVLFVVEFALRAHVFLHIEDIRREEAPGANANASIHALARLKTKKLEELSLAMRFGVLAPLSSTYLRRMPGAIWRMLKDPYTCFDFTIITLSLLDALLIMQLRKAGVLEVKMDVLSALRIFRLFRLAKLLRVFKLMPKLRLLVLALTSVWRTIAWSLVLTLIVLYAFAVYSVMLIGRSPKGMNDPVIQEYLGGLLPAMLTGWQLLTFDGGDVILHKVLHEFPWHGPVFFMLIISLGVGMMKMLVGVLCESAIMLVREEQAEKAHEKYLRFLRSMTDLQDLFKQRLGKSSIAQEILESALDVQIRAKHADLAHIGAGTNLINDNEMSLKEWQVGSSDEFAEELHEVLARAQLSPALVKRIFEKVDYQRYGRVSIDAFAKAALGRREDLTRIEMFAISTAIRDIREQVAKLESRLHYFHGQLQIMLLEMQLLVQRHGHPTKGKLGAAGLNAAGPLCDGHHAGALCQASRRLLRSRQPDLGLLSSAGEDALKDLVTFTGEGPLPDVEMLGEMKSVQGTGVVWLYDDQIIGERTEFRQEVNAEDLIMFTHDSLVDGPSRRTSVFVVQRVLGNFGLKVCCRNKELLSMEKRVPFMIVKGARSARLKFEADEEDEAGEAEPVHIASKDVVVKCRSDDVGKSNSLPCRTENGRRQSVASSNDEDRPLAKRKEYNRCTTVEFKKALRPQRDLNTLFALGVRAPAADLSPRSAQRLFEWDLRTKQREVAWAKGHTKRKGKLLSKFHDLEKDIAALWLRRVAFETFRTFRRIVKEQRRIRAVVQDRKKPALGR